MTSIYLMGIFDKSTFLNFLSPFHQNVVEIHQDLVSTGSRTGPELTCDPVGSYVYHAHYRLTLWRLSLSGRFLQKVAIFLATSKFSAQKSYCHIIAILLLMMLPLQLTLLQWYRIKWFYHCSTRIVETRLLY